MVGRNELCPCGSGRKYKKCCLEKDKAKDIARNRIKLGEKQFDNVITKISESTSEDYKAYKNKCEVDFGVSSYELENLMNVYYLVNYKYNKQSSLMMNYFNKHKQNINDADAEIIENTLNSYMSVYQVKEKDINKVLLRDIVLNEDVYVEDIDLFSEFKVGDFLLARIIPVGNTKIFVDKVVKINESRKTQIKNDIDNRFKQTKKKCKTKKQCLINNIKFMYQNLIEVRREYIVDTSCDVVEENIEEVLHEYVEENKPKVVQIDNKNKKQKEKQKESKLTLIQNREKEIANKAYQKEKIDEKPVIEHGEKEIILEIEEPITQTLKEEVEKEQKKILWAIVLLTSTTTALVGPMMFFGFMMSNLAYLLIKEYQHKWLFSVAILLGFLSLTTGQMLVERVFQLQINVNMVIELVGGLFFFYLLAKEAKR